MMAALLAMAGQLLGSEAAAAAVVTGPELAARYVANWTAPPKFRCFPTVPCSGIGWGRLSGAPLSGAPLLGNGDLGISVGGHLPGKPQPQPPPPGGQFAVGHALCNASDVRQLWAGKALSSAGGSIVSAITNRGAPVGQCLSTFDLRPLTMRTCGDGDTMWSYDAAKLHLTTAPSSTHAKYCLDADSASTKTKPNQPGWVLLSAGCGAKTEQYLYVPVGSSGAGLLKPQCPQPAVPAWQCPGLAGQCLTVHSNSAPPPPSPVLPSAAASGALTLNFGSNQMWGLREYNRCMHETNSRLNKPGCVHFDSDSTFPRRLGLGGLTISPDANHSTALTASLFSAEMHIATAEVRAALTLPTTGASGASLRLHVVLAPDENTVLTTVTAEPPMTVTITSWVLPLGPLVSPAFSRLDSSMKQPCTPSTDPSVPGCLDGSVGAGVGAGRDGSVFWSQRQPLSALSSTKPINIAMASTVVQQQPLRCELVSTSAAACTYQVGPSGLQIATSVLSNLDLCPGHDRPGSPACAVDPLNASVARAASVSPAAILRANSAWWYDYWNATSVAIPGDSVLERFYYAHSYLIGSASRAGRVAAGLWGPWVHDDSPAWGGDFTLDYVSTPCSTFALPSVPPSDLCPLRRLNLTLHLNESVTEPRGEPLGPVRQQPLVASAAAVRTLAGVPPQGPRAGGLLQLQQ